jgi:hypothetical protein
MHDEEWIELAEQICEEYPDFTIDDVVREVSEAAGDAGIVKARAVVRRSLDAIALQRTGVAVARPGEPQDAPNLAAVRADQHTMR